MGEVGEGWEGMESGVGGERRVEGGVKLGRGRGEVA